MALNSIFSERLEEKQGPKVTSTDPNERKLARRIRIENRLEALHQAQLARSQSELWTPKSAIQSQVEKSAKILEIFLHESKDYLTNINFANCIRKKEQCAKNEVTKKRVKAELEAEAKLAVQKFNEIINKMCEIKQLNDPLQIHEEILHQKMKCDELIQQKDELIKKLKLELLKAEHILEQHQAKQKDDIDILSERIEKQIVLIRKAFLNEFNIIDLVISEEKEKYISNINQRWQDTYTKRNETEAEFSEWKFKTIDKMKASIEKLSIEAEERFREAKKNLERDVQYSQTELENVKAIVMTNIFSLEYNYHIYKLRENESVYIVANQRRRINKLQEILNNLKKQLNDYKSNVKQQMEKYTKGIKKLQQNIIEIEAKADHLAIVNNQKFNQLFDLNRNHAVSILKQIASIDKILHQQQMGEVWTPLSFKSIDKTTMPSYLRALSSLNLPLTMGSKSTLTSASRKQVADTAKSAVNNDSNLSYKRLLKHILTILSDKSGFLTEKHMSILIHEYEDKNKSLVTLNNVFISLGILKPEDIDIIINYFLPYCYCPTCADPYSNLEVVSQTAISYSTVISHYSNLDRRTHERSIQYFASIDELDRAMDSIQVADDVVEDVILEIVSSDISLEDEFKKDEDSLEGDALVDLFYTDLKEKKAGKKRAHIQDEKVFCKFKHPLVMSTVYVLTALKDFVAFYHTNLKKIPTNRERLEKKRLTVSRLVLNQDIEDMWNQLKNVFSDRHINVWNGLLDSLSKFLDILKHRKQLSVEVTTLRKKNANLKKLLNQYMDRHRPLKPPCALQREAKVNSCSTVNLYLH